MTNELRRILRLIILSLTTGISTSATAFISAAQAGPITPMTKTIAILGGIVATCSTIASGLSEPPMRER